MAPHSSTLAWKILWMEEPSRLQCMGSLRVGHDWATSFSLFTFMHWRRKWQPIPLFLPRESQGWQSLVGCCVWGRTESDMTEVTQQQQQQQRSLQENERYKGNISCKNNLLVEFCGCCHHPYWIWSPRKWNLTLFPCFVLYWSHTTQVSLESTGQDWIPWARTWT